MAEKFRLMKEKNNQRKEAVIDAMSAEEVMADLKKKGLPTFGTGLERRDRLKKAAGSLVDPGIIMNPYPSNNQLVYAPPPPPEPVMPEIPKLVKKSSVVDKVEE